MLSWFVPGIDGRTERAADGQPDGTVEDDGTGRRVSGGGRPDRGEGGPEGGRPGVGRPEGGRQGGGRPGGSRPEGGRPGGGRPGRGQPSKSESPHLSDNWPGSSYCLHILLSLFNLIAINYVV